LSSFSALANQRALGLLGCLSVQRIAVAAFPVVLVVTVAGLRGYGAAAAVQGVYVVVSTSTAPLRARALDRIGRNRVIIPQTVMFSAFLVLFGVAVTARAVPFPVVLLAAIVPPALSPAFDPVIRTLWRTIAQDEHQVKALHSYDSIVEESGFLLGPALASALMISVGRTGALYATIAAIICGYSLALLSGEVRAALRPRAGTGAAKPATAHADKRRGRRLLAAVAGPIASRELQRIVLPLILMGSVFGVAAIAAPAACATAGHSDWAGFVLAAISLGGIAGAAIYSAARLKWNLRARHAALGLAFGVPLTFGFLAVSPWALGLVLFLGGFAVTPLYINAYLMMDADIPRDAIHEANTWVPVGNNVGYIIGISAAGAVLGRTDVHAALILVSVLAAVLVAYSLIQLGIARRSMPMRPEQAGTEA
jgi:MFS family permease